MSEVITRVEIELAKYSRVNQEEILLSYLSSRLDTSLSVYQKELENRCQHVITSMKSYEATKEIIR